MTDQSQPQSGETNNPLDDLAGDLSAKMMGETVEVKNSSVEEVQGGQVKMINSAIRSLHAHAMDMSESAVGAACGASARRLIRSAIIVCCCA